MADAAPALGALQLYLVGDLARGGVRPESELELVLIQETDVPFHRRPDFWVSHLRPRVGTRFSVFTPEEFDELEQEDPLLREAQREGRALLD